MLYSLKNFEGENFPRITRLFLKILFLKILIFQRWLLKIIVSLSFPCTNIRHTLFCRFKNFIMKIAF